MTIRPIDPVALVDPELRPALDRMILESPSPEARITPDALRSIRARGAATQKPFLREPGVAARTIGVPDAPDLALFVINADPASTKPAILHLHGGGFVAGSAGGSVADMQVIAKALECVVVTVEYRLAPETSFPGALDDNYAALRWVFDHAAELGVDRDRIALLGESAGGGHAAMLALAARDRGEVAASFLALSCPMLDDRTGKSVRLPPHLGAFVWRPALNAAAWSALLGDSEGRGPVPAREADLSGLPPIFIGTGSVDLFAPENIAFAGRLVEAGVPVELLVVPGAFHAFDTLAPHARASRRYRLALLNALARAFGRAELATPPEPAPPLFAGIAAA
ncbi:MAG: alpha/beta hydrolase [Sphingopyxis sp.]|nr:alpha/beta hydrolase [Sphingopyxis sp.]